MGDILMQPRDDDGIAAISAIVDGRYRSSGFQDGFCTLRGRHSTGSLDPLDSSYTCRPTIPFPTEPGERLTLSITLP